VGATGDGNLFAYYVPSAAGGAVTVTANLSAGDYIGLGILEYTGLSTAVLDVVKDGLLADTGTFQSTRTMTLTASGPTAAASELALLIGSDTHNDAAYTATGWTRRVDLEDGTNSANLAVFDQILTSVITPSGTLTRTELVSGSDGFVGQLLTFQSSGGAPAFRPRPNPLRFQAVTRAATY
jgi:hypothetical protein